MNKSYFLASLEKVATMINERTNIVKVVFDNESLDITLKGEKETGKAQDIIQAESKDKMPQDAPFEIGFNYRYLIDCLKSNTDVENVTFRFGETNVAAVLVEGDFTTLIMPIQIK